MPTPGQIEWAFEVLKDQEIGQIKHALIMHARDQHAGQYQPKPADVIRHIEGSIDDRKAAAAFAYAKAIDAISSVTGGSYGSVVFDDPAIMYAIQCGFSGWVNFCNAKQHDFDRKKFCDEYANYREGLPYPKCLDGQCAITNGSQFSEFNKISTIGSVEKCRIVYSGGRAITDNSSVTNIEGLIPKLAAVGAG